MWEGGECWIIGGGPSIPYEFGVPQDVIDAVQQGRQPVDVYSPYLSRLHDSHVIGVNAAFLLGDWIDFIFFGDTGFFWRNQTKLMEFSKPKVSCHKYWAENGEEYGVKYTPKMGGKPKGIAARMNYVCWNNNSGAAAINVAYHLGVKRIYLLGFDMELGEHVNQHWHRHYMAPGVKKDARKTPFHRHKLSFPYVVKDAKILGLEIINVSQSSTIKQFPKARIEDIL